MTRTDFVLAVMATADGEPFTPTQIQKLFFILDRKIPEQIGGARFDFVPDGCGPYDVDVYRETEALEAQGLALILGAGFEPKQYRLTPKGQRNGEQFLRRLPPDAQKYASRVSEWVRGISFRALVSAVIREFPDMGTNAVFRKD